jgi:hypothetical protein
MNPDDLKQIWQKPAAQGRLMVDAELLLREVRRNDNWFRATIFLRDAREVSVAVVMLPVWLWMGIALKLPWSWYLMIPALIWVGGFMLVDLLRHGRKELGAGEPLIPLLSDSLAQIEHQIWVLQGVFWWALLPTGLAMAIFLSQFAIQLAGRPGIKTWNVGVVTGQTATLAIVVFAGIYWLNQRAVRRTLLPRRQELEALLASLSDHSDQNRIDVKPPST